MAFKSFAEMKKKGSDLSRLTAAADKLNQKNSYVDERYWDITKDKAGNGYAVIRFLPEPAGEDLSWVQKYSHGFKYNGKWFIENCPTTIGLPCPVCEANGEAWNSGDQDTARNRKRKLRYISNILVLKDPGNPENEGKVFLYSYGQKIFDKIQEMMKPEIPDEKPVNPFDFWEGADFHLKVAVVRQFPNYDSSKFAKPSELFDGDENKLKEVWDSEYSLQGEITPDKFKSYEDLEKRFNTLMGVKTSGGSSKQQQRFVDTTEDQTLKEDEDVLNMMSNTPGTKSSDYTVDDDDDTIPFNVDDDDDDLDDIKALANR